MLLMGAVVMVSELMDENMQERKGTSLHLRETAHDPIL